MKVLLIQPPQWMPVSPHLAVPLLKAQLMNAGINAKAYDLNVKFFNSLLKNECVRQADIKGRADLAELSEKLKNTDVNELQKNGSYAQQTEYLKYLSLKKFYSEHGNETDYIINNTEKAVYTLKTLDEILVPEKMMEAKHIIRLALRVLSMPFAPNEIDLDNYFARPLLKLDWSSIKLQAADKSINMFYDYLYAFAKETAVENYDAISISLTDLSQLIPVFTLAGFLKKTTSAKIILGGNYATQIYEDMLRHSDIFTDYIDFLLTGDGEKTVCELCMAIDGKLPLSEVHSLHYFQKDENRIISTNAVCQRLELDSLSYADYSDYDMTDYFSPEPLFPIQLSKGCYWGKCSFCDYFYGQHSYSPKRIPVIIDEIKHYVNEYNAKLFIFVDEAIPPAFYDKLALAIKEAELNIYFYSFARLENGYTPEVLSHLYDAGARLFLWGYECDSLRVMSLMNKGINAERRLDILRDSRNAGIWNTGLFIFGYPTETKEEILSTMQTIRNNRDIIPSVTLSNFALKKHSKIIENPKENGIKEYSDNGEFYTVYRDIAEGVSQAERRSYRRDFQFDFLDENEHSLWAVVFSDFDHLLLYLSHYGCDYVSSYRSQKRICPEFR